MQRKRHKHTLWTQVLLKSYAWVDAEELAPVNTSVRVTGEPIPLLPQQRENVETICLLEYLPSASLFSTAAIQRPRPANSPTGVVSQPFGYV